MVIYPQPTARAQPDDIAQEALMDLAANVDVIVTFDVIRYLSVTQGTMLTSGASPDVITTLQDVSGSGRVTRVSNGSFVVSGSDPNGNNPLVLKLVVLPTEAYAVKGLIIRNVHNVSEGGVVWD